MATPPTCDLTGVRAIYRGDTWGPHRVVIGRRVDDAVLVISDTTVTSADADFVAGDVGATIAAYTVTDGEWVLNTSIPALTTIASVNSQASVEMSAAAVATVDPAAIVIGAKDLTGYTFLSQIRAGWNTADIAGTITVTVFDTDSGILDLSITAANTALLTSGQYVWDLQATSGAAAVETLARGNVTVLPDASRA